MDPAIRLLRDLIAINSVNPTLVPGAPGEREIADAVAAAMRRAGLDVSVEDAGGGRPNVVGVLEGRVRGRSLMFCGHTDTAGVDEEHSSIGADALVKTWRADGAVVTEPTDLAIAIGHKGFAWVEVEVFGRAAHGSRPAEGIDAILRLGRILVRLEALDRSLQ